MVAIELRFPAGRFHATPWGRHVNEGVPEWPPAPFRLARAMLDAVYRRHPDWPSERVEPLLDVMSSPVRFRLPPAVTHHTRSFLPENKRNLSDRTMVLDAFVAVDRSQPVMLFFDTTASPSTLHDLQDLLGGLNYLGRSESWITVDVRGSVDDSSANCVPSEERSRFDRDLLETWVACLRRREGFSSAMNELAGSPAAERFTWIDAICLSTGELLKRGWTESPVLERISYCYPRDLLDGRPMPRPRGVRRRRPVLARYQLSSTVLPLATETLPFAENIRRKLMGIHKKILDGDPTAVSPCFSGKNPDGRPVEGHTHAFFLPRDEDGDGRIDHLLVYCKGGFDHDEVQALDYLRSIWQGHGRPDVHLTLLSMHDDPTGPRSRRFASHTPFVTVRHHRKGRGPFLDWLAGEIARECSYHGLPDPLEIRWIDRTRGPGHRFRWLEFTRSRKGELPRTGFGCEITFPEPIEGPVALGAYCHFGLGQFLPVAGA